MGQNRKKAVILLSGGLDSATTLYYAVSKGYSCHCLLFDYNQRHKKELLAAKKLAKIKKCPVTIVKIALPWSNSALTDKKVKVPEQNINIGGKIPVTYVPARNTIFLSFAASLAESIGARNIFIGANALDYSGYPDCRPAYIKAYEKAVNLGTKSGAEGRKLKIETPLIHLTKKEIIHMGMKLKVPYELTWSCYNGGSKPCGVCDSCMIRANGFLAARKRQGTRKSITLRSLYLKMIQ